MLVATDLQMISIWEQSWHDSRWHETPAVTN